MHHGAPDRVLATEQAGGLGHATVAEQFADPGRGDAAFVGRADVVAQVDVVDELDTEAVLLPQSTQQVDVPGAAGAEPEVAADEDQLGVQGADQDLGDERLGRLRLQVLVEAQQEHRVDPDVLEELASLRGARQRGWHALGVDDAERVAVEGHHGGDESAIAGGTLEVRDHRAVSDVDPVELADGDGARAEALRHVRDVVVVLHAGPYSPTVADAVAGSATAVRWCFRSHQSPAIGSTSGAKT